MGGFSIRTSRARPLDKGRRVEWVACILFDYWLGWLVLQCPKSQTFLAWLESFLKNLTWGFVTVSLSLFSMRFGSSLC